MNRRQFLLGTIAVGTSVTAAGLWLTHNRVAIADLTMANALTRLDQVMFSKPQTLGDWNLAQVFNHCAQSVEFSMVGFPEHKPQWFKETIGELAFDVFSSRGQMMHNLSEAIPGAPKLNEGANVDEAYERFKTAMVSFSQYEGALAEHFAFGELSKDQYERAHVMHFYNHLQEITI